jgi:broad specificity phosphatase PhoE
MTSVDNEAGRASGHADPPLSSLGQQRAQELGQHYAREVLHAVYCSDLQRAVTTAQIAFAARDLPILPDARLREYDYGDLTQHPVAQVEAEFLRRLREPFPHGESLLMVVARVGAFLRDVLREHDGRSIVVIGHRATRYGLEYWCGDATLEEIIRTPWEWREIPIWRYEIHPRQIEERAVAL